MIQGLVSQFKLGQHERTGQHVLSFLLEINKELGQVPEEIEHGQVVHALHGQVQMEHQKVRDFGERDGALEQNEKKILEVLIGVVEGDEEVLVILTSSVRMRFWTRSSSSSLDVSWSTRSKSSTSRSNWSQSTRADKLFCSWDWVWSWARLAKWKIFRISSFLSIFLFSSSKFLRLNSKMLWRSSTRNFLKFFFLKISPRTRSSKSFSEFKYAKISLKSSQLFNFRVSLMNCESNLKSFPDDENKFSMKYFEFKRDRL